MLNPCPFCQHPVRVERILVGHGAFFVACTNVKCAARWPREARRFHAVEDYERWWKRVGLVTK